MASSSSANRTHVDQPRQQTAQSGITRHSEYYFEDGNFILLVENHLYNIHRGLLQRHSELFCTMLSMPQPPGKNIDGSKDSCPVRLPDVKSIEFERLLWILYPPVMGEFKANGLVDWVPILDLATRWAFEGVRNLAVKEIEKVATEPLDRILISRKYHVKPEWLLPAYLALCERREHLSLEEAYRINNLEIVARLAQAREVVQKSIWAKERDPSMFWQPPIFGNPAFPRGLTTQDLQSSALNMAEKTRKEHLTLVAEAFGLEVPPDPHSRKSVAFTISH